MGMDLEEGDEDAYNEHQREREVSQPVPPVNIVISEPTNAEPEVVDVEADVTPSTEYDGEEPLGEDLADEEDRFSDLGEDVDVDREEEEEEDARSLRRSSHGTTVITPADEHELHDGWSENEAGQGNGDDIDDAASDWTESVVGRESDVGMEREASVPVAAAS